MYDEEKHIWILPSISHWPTGCVILITAGFQTPSAVSESSSEPEAITAAPPEPAPPTTSVHSFYNSAPCLPPYTAYDLQVSITQTSSFTWGKKKNGFENNMGFFFLFFFFNFIPAGYLHIPGLIWSLGWFPVWSESPVAYVGPSTLLPSSQASRWETTAVQSIRKLPEVLRVVVTCQVCAEPLSLFPPSGADFETIARF